MSAVTPFNTNDITLFQPNQVAGLALWLDAADSDSVVRSGSTVSAWNDKSGNRYNATAFGTPTYVNYAANNLSAIRFNGTSSYFSIPGNQLDIASEDFAIFAVVQYTPRVAQIPIIGKGVGALTTQQWRLNFDPNNIFQILILKNSVVAQSSAIYSTAGWTLFGGVVYRATTIQGFTNGNGLTATATSGVVGSLSDTATNVEIGRGWFGGFFFNSDMGEILLYKGTITASQRQQIESYLAYKWNLQSSLPTTHPYYNSPYNAYPPFTNINQITKFAYPVLPSDVGGLALWLDAADGNSVAQVGGVVSAWNDKSGSNNHATQITVGNRPTYLNSFVSLNGVDQFFNVNLDFLAGVSHNFFIVLRNFNYTNIYGAANGSLSQNSLHIGFAGVGSYRMNYWGNDFQPSITANYKVNQTNLLNFNWVNNATKTIYANGSLEGTLAQPGIIGTMSGGGRIGNVANNGGIFNPGFLSANIYEILIYTGTITVDQRQAIEGYLAWKWNIQSSLPATQPYYNNAFIANLPRSIPRNIQQYQYNPQIISGLALWLDAADGSTLFQNTAGTTSVTNGSQIQLWKDKSSSLNNATNSQTVMTYNSSGLNGLPAISFPGTQTTGFSLVGALLPNGSSDASYFFVLNKNNGATQVFFTHGGATQLKQFFAGGSLNIDRAGQSLISDGTSIVNLNTIVSCTQTSLSAGVNAWRNGSIFSSTGATITWNVNTTAAWLGSGGTAGTGFIYAGVISEVIVYRTALTTNQRQQIEGYLAWKWGLQKSLPSNHPFYLFPQG